MSKIQVKYTRGKNSKSRNGFKNGYNVSEETREKISKANKGRKHTKEAKEKMSIKQKGHSVSIKTRRKIGLANSIALKGKHPTEETRKKLSKVKRGKKLSEEHKKNMRKNNVHYWLGKKRGKMSKKWRDRIGLANSKVPHLKGENHYNWQGGKSFEPYGIEFNNKLREQIRKRDSYRCQECFRHQDELFTKKGKCRKLVVHHIDYNKQNNNPDNLISLCLGCHLQTNFKRENWTNYFNRSK